MVASNLFGLSNEKIVVLGTPLYTERVVKTATNLKPGCLMTVDTTAGERKVCGATDNPTGWAGYEHTSPKFRPATKDTAYVAKDVVAELFGQGFLIEATLAAGAGNVVTEGDYVVQAANGQVAKATSGYTVATGGVAVVSSAANGAIIEGNAPATKVVGIVRTAADPTSAAKKILVQSLI